jgi:hypothetical protein
MDVAGTNHYTITLGEPGAGVVAAQVLARLTRTVTGGPELSGQAGQ